MLGARYLHRMISAGDLRTGLAGVGVSTLAVWLAADSLRAAGIAFDLLAEGGMYGYVPLPLGPLPVQLPKPVHQYFAVQCPDGVGCYWRWRGQPHGRGPRCSPGRRHRRDQHKPHRRPHADRFRRW